MLAVDDVDGHRPRVSNALTGAGVRHDADGQLRHAARHDATMVQRERALAALQRAGDAFDRDVD